MAADGRHDLLARGVGQDQVGHHDLVGHGLGDELGDAGRLADDDEVRFVVEEEPDAGPHDRVVVEDEDPAGRSAGSVRSRVIRDLTRGRVATPRARSAGCPAAGRARWPAPPFPSPGADSICIVPSSRRARSSMQSSPMPLPGRERPVRPVRTPRRRPERPPSGVSPAWRQRDRHRPGRGVTHDIGQRLLHDSVDRRFDPDGEAGLDLAGDLDRQTCPRPDGGGQ